MADLIVVGAGLAGAECAWAAAQRGRQVLLLTSLLDTIYHLPGSPLPPPAPPGSLLAQLLRGDVWDQVTGGVRPERLSHNAKLVLEWEEHITLLQSTVVDLLWDEQGVHGVRTREGFDYQAPVTVLAVGSFLKGRMTIGQTVIPAGRRREFSSEELAAALERRGVPLKQVQCQGGAWTVAGEYVADREVPQEQLRSPPYALRHLAVDLERWRPPPGLYVIGQATGYTLYAEALRQGVELGQRL
ncbi:MAG: FAD-dependent oxidoreductase [Deinococcus sp.]|nr:FAD-dependent oxidoreductase [Deinococcus sp.]